MDTRLAKEDQHIAQQKLVEYTLVHANHTLFLVMHVDFVSHNEPDILCVASFFYCYPYTNILCVASFFYCSLLISILLIYCIEYKSPHSQCTDSHSTFTSSKTEPPIHLPTITTTTTISRRKRTGALLVNTTTVINRKGIFALYLLTFRYF